MNTSLLARSNKDLILESVYNEVPYEVFMAIYLANDIETVSDLRSVLSVDDYESVRECVKLHFFRQAMCNYMKFLEICGRAPEDLSEDKSIEW